MMIKNDFLLIHINSFTSSSLGKLILVPFLVTLILLHLLANYADFYRSFVLTYIEANVPIQQSPAPVVSTAVTLYAGIIVLSGNYVPLSPSVKIYLTLLNY